MKPLRIALAQIAPRLGDLGANLDRHRELIEEARAADAGLVVFPELGLTGYLLQDLASEVAMRLDDPRLGELATATRGLSAVVSFVEESGDHRLFIAAALIEDGAHPARPSQGLPADLRPLRRAAVLRPGRRDPGRSVPARRRRRARGLRGLLARVGAQVLALDGAQILINISSSPGRDLARTNEMGLGTASSWRILMRTYAQLTTSFVVFCNRVGIDESISFWGGSEVIGPSGAPIFSAPFYDEGLFIVDVSLGDVRRERIGLPLLRDERPELIVRELERIVAERAGLAVDSTAEDGGGGRTPTSPRHWERVP